MHPVEHVHAQNQRFQVRMVMGAPHLQHVGRMHRGSSVILTPDPFGDFVGQLGRCPIVRVWERLGEPNLSGDSGKYENEDDVWCHLFSSGWFFEIISIVRLMSQTEHVAWI